MLLARLGDASAATFLDTPAGFQLNADQIAAGAADYFAKRVGHHLGIASYKSREIDELDTALAFQRLRKSNYILMGPGSPTYAIDQFRDSPVSSILSDCVHGGGCVVAASAAALTMGRYTLPVYEIYKVGQQLHWQPGLNLLKEFDLPLVVVPHWNNAEGGTHDTSRCFMGKTRFDILTDLMTEPVPILGLDEHTACIIDLGDDTFQIRGIGTVTYVSVGRSHSQVFRCGTTHPLSILRGEKKAFDTPAAVESTETESTKVSSSIGGFWQLVHGLEKTFYQAIDAADLKGATTALLEFDRILWNAHDEQQGSESIVQCRDLFRELLVVIGTRTSGAGSHLQHALAPVIESLLLQRQQFRSEGNWQAADALRDALLQAGITVEDAADGYHWRLDDRAKEEHD